jgi:hypothetical protein
LAWSLEHIYCEGTEWNWLRIYAITGFGVIGSGSSGSDARELFIYLILRIFRKWFVREGGGLNWLRIVSDDGRLPDS